MMNFIIQVGGAVVIFVIAYAIAYFCGLITDNKSISLLRIIVIALGIGLCIFVFIIFNNLRRR